MRGCRRSGRRRASRWLSRTNGVELVAELAQVLGERQHLLDRAVVQVEAEPCEAPLGRLRQRPLAIGAAGEQRFALEHGAQRRCALGQVRGRAGSRTRCGPRSRREAHRAGSRRRSAARARRRLASRRRPPSTRSAACACRAGRSRRRRAPAPARPRRACGATARPGRRRRDAAAGAAAISAATTGGSSSSAGSAHRRARRRRTRRTSSGVPADVGERLHGGPGRVGVEPSVRGELEENVGGERSSRPAGPRPVTGRPRRAPTAPVRPARRPSRPAARTLRLRRARPWTSSRIDAAADPSRAVPVIAADPAPPRCRIGLAHGPPRTVPMTDASQRRSVGTSTSCSTAAMISSVSFHLSNTRTPSGERARRHPRRPARR